ncbi:phage major capsid protein [Leisingera sp. F5]|uniref:phage major capsid protein n=1 Tax=Leisingera sp. F5 TaxID=1813816 RepID=UPI000B115AF5|nr:phage major capsid protein [Leisingera sp. F5]
MTPKEMRAKRANLITEARGLRTEIDAEGTTEARGAELETRFKAMITEAEGLETRAQDVERLEALEASQSAGDSRRPNGGEGRSAAGGEPDAVSYRAAFHQWLGAAGEAHLLAPEVRQALARGQTQFSHLTPEQRAQLAGTGAAGGNLIPDEAMAPLVKAMAAFGPMFDDTFARVLKTTGGASLPIPGIDDLANEAAANTEEGNPGTGLGTGTDAVFTKKTLEDYMVETGWIGVSIQLATGAMPDVEAVLGELLGERIGRKANRDLTVGTGTGQALGVVTGATASGVNIASTSALTAEEVLDFYHSIDAAYRASAKFGAMFNDNTLLALHKLKDGQGNFLIEEAPDNAGMIKVGPVRFRYKVNPAMADIGANSRSMVMGDMGKYFVRKIGGTVLMTARDSKFQPGFGLAAYTRFDGAVADPRAIKALVHPAS